MSGLVGVVDDDEIVRELVTTILETRGYEVRAFPGVKAARAAFDASPPDLLVVDVRLPDGCGLELVGSVRNALGKPVPAIVLSGMRDERDFGRGFAAGAVDYLGKPFKREELLARCAVHLARTATFDPPAATSETELPEKDGLAFGRYRIERELGRGGYGRVYLARDDVRNQALVALKVLSPVAAIQSEARMRFVRETYTLASVSDPRIVAVHDVGAVQGRLYFAMEYVRGESLAARTSRIGPQGEAPARALLRETLGACCSLERAGILHRDLKPDNVILRDGRADQPMLVDFGLAKRAMDKGITAQNLLVGTLAFLPPEVIRGREPDHRSDLFALGLTIRAALTGTDVFPELNGIDLLTAIVQGPIPLPTGSLTPGFAKLLASLCAIEPRDRPATARAALDVLESLPPAPEALAPAEPTGAIREAATQRVSRIS